MRDNTLITNDLATDLFSNPIIQSKPRARQTRKTKKIETAAGEKFMYLQEGRTGAAIQRKEAARKAAAWQALKDEYIQEMTSTQIKMNFQFNLFN